jgi:hypothetical protein
MRYVKLNLNQEQITTKRNHCGWYHQANQANFNKSNIYNNIYCFLFSLNLSHQNQIKVEIELFTNTIASNSTDQTNELTNKRVCKHPSTCRPLPASSACHAHGPPPFWHPPCAWLVQSTPLLGPPTWPPWGGTRLEPWPSYCAWPRSYSSV